MTKVKVYSTPTCGHCVSLKRFLDEKNIVYEDIDVSANQEILQEMITKSGQFFVPVLEVDGEYIVGFNKYEICKKLNIEE